MASFSPLEVGLIFFAGFGNGFLVRTFGAGVGLALMPLLVMAFQPAFSLGLIAIFSVMAALGMTRAFWGKSDRATILVLLPGVLAGMITGTWILTQLTPGKIRLLIGIICFALAAYQAFIEVRGRPFVIPHMPAWQGAGFGIMSGLSSSLANSGAIFLTPILISRNFDKQKLVGTLWLLYIIVNPLKVAAYWQADIVTTHTLWASLIGLPALCGGLLVGAWVYHRLSGRAFNFSVLAIALAGSLRLIAGN